MMPDGSPRDRAAPGTAAPAHQSGSEIGAQRACQLAATVLDLADADGGGGVAAAVADPHGHLVAFLRGGGAPLRASRIAIMKAYTAARFTESTDALARRLEASGRSLCEYGDRRFTALAGGVPVEAPSGRILGALGVSGRSPSDDDGLARCALDALGLGTSSRRQVQR